MFGLLTRIFGTKNQRTIKKYQGFLDRFVMPWSKKYAVLSLDQLIVEWQDVRLQWSDLSKDDRQGRAFAAAQRFSELILEKRHYSVQLLGGYALCDGNIVEMATGEGKTLVATLPAIYQALEGQKVFVVTVNDYLAERDATWMQPLYAAFGLTVGIVTGEKSWAEKKMAYDADIIYVTNHRLGFDYLEDHLVTRKEELLLPSLDFVIIDEVDSILIDEARMPLIISAPKNQDLTLYPKIHQAVLNLQLATDDLDPETGDFSIDHRAHQVTLSDRGHAHVEEILQRLNLIDPDASLYDPKYSEILHVVMCALRAQHLYHRERQYLVIDQKVVIVNEHTGRLAIGQRYSEGLHQAIEAKEGVPIQQETMTIASITYQNFFKLFGKICGMTGTADTEAHEFHQIYGLEVVVIPTNRKVQRIDHPDLVFMSHDAQEKALVAAVVEHHRHGRPVLLGTRSIDKSEHLSHLLKSQGIPHVVLNAKHHDREAQIIAQAGTLGAVTIATNMAGRGTDILLGGTFEYFSQQHPDWSHDEAYAQWKVQQEHIKSIGGLQVIGCERHDSRRIDNQLQGRSGRQGDPGSSQFYLSFDDTLMKMVPQTLVGLMQYFHNDPIAPISDPVMDRKISEFQKMREGMNFDARKNALEDDNVINDQRKVVYACRENLLLADDLRPALLNYAQEVAFQVMREIQTAFDPAQAFEHVNRFFQQQYDVSLDAYQKELMARQAPGLELKIGQAIYESYLSRIQELDRTRVQSFERDVMLKNLDYLWREHLTQLESVKQQVSLRGYAQKDPKQEYKIEAFKVFERFMAHYARQIMHILLSARFIIQPADTSDNVDQQQELKKTIASQMAGHTGRNHSCPCGSGKKYKHCCGALKKDSTSGS